MHRYLTRHHAPIKYGEVVPPLPALPAGDAGLFTRSWDDRLWLFQRRWEPAGAVKATLIIVHGTVDHSGVYSELGQSLAGAGVAVFALDMRGWGLSDGESMYFNDLNAFVADVDAAYKQIHEDPRYSSVKSRFLLGKSLGGLVAGFTALQHPDHFTGLLGLSSLYQLGPEMAPHPLARLLLKALSAVAPKLPAKRPFDPKLIVSDAAALDAWKADPLCSKDKVRVGYITEALRCAEVLPTKVPDLKIAMLLMWGSADKVVTRAGHEMLIQQSASTDKKLEVYDGGYHNLLAEPALKEKVIDDIRSWILERYP